LHILVSDGCFHKNGIFSVSPAIDANALEQIFRHKVLKMLLAKGKITQDMIALLDKWRHTGFNVFSGPRITLDKALDQAAAKGWIIVDMKRNWKKVFPPK
jgi:hypothetical protein